MRTPEQIVYDYMNRLYGTERKYHPFKWSKSNREGMFEVQMQNALSLFAEVQKEAMAEQRRLDSAIALSFRNVYDAATCNAINGEILKGDV